MKKRNLGLALTAVLASSTLLAACGSDDAKKGDTKKEDKDNFTVAMVTDTGGIDDKSFNQSTWDGIQEYGKENGLTKGDGGIDYLQSNQDSEFTTNLQKLVRRDFDLIFAVGYKLHDSVSQVAKQQKDFLFLLHYPTFEKSKKISFLSLVCFVFRDQLESVMAFDYISYVRSCK